MPAVLASKQQLKLVWVSKRALSSDNKGGEGKEQAGEEERRQAEEEQRDEEEREQREEILQAGTSVSSLRGRRMDGVQHGMMCAIAVVVVWCLVFGDCRRRASCTCLAFWR